jgi:hypothetical protein
MDFTRLATDEELSITTAHLTERGFIPHVVSSSIDALDLIKTLIPSGSSVMTGSSKTLGQIGFTSYLKSTEHSWNNLHAAILSESDPIKQSQLRKQSVIADYYLGSVHAVTHSGELVFASNTGSQMPHLVYTSPNLILIVGTQKLVPDLSQAFLRIQDYIFPLEDQRIRALYGEGTMHSKTLIMHRENPSLQRHVHVVFVKESLGF